MNLTLTGWLFALAALGILLWANFDLKRRSAEGRLVERIQQLICAAHFLAVIAWIERARLGISAPEIGSSPTLLGYLFEFLAVAVALIMIILCVKLNAGIQWKNFFSVYAGIALGYAVLFGGISLVFSKHLGFEPTVEKLLSKGKTITELVE
jgi:ATP/ADP translocase